MTEKKLRLPKHGYLGYYYGTNKTYVRELIGKKYIITDGVKIIVNDSYDKNVFEVEVVKKVK